MLVTPNWETCWGRATVEQAPYDERSVRMSSIRTDNVVNLFDTDAMSSSMRARLLLARKFGLNPEEARLVMAIASGRTLPQYAEIRAVCITTARTQLASAMAKIGVRRKADLVQAVVLATAQPAEEPQSL